MTVTTVPQSEEPEEVEAPEVDLHLEQVIDRDDIPEPFRESMYDQGGELRQMILKNMAARITAQCRTAAYRRALINTYTKKYELLLEQGEYDEYHPCLRQLRDKVDEYAKKTSDWLLLTVNPREGVSLSDFVQKVEKAVKKKWIQQVHWVFEQRSETSDYRGMHAHILYRHQNKKLSEMRREFMSTFHTICDVQNPKILNFQMVPGEEDFKRMVQYLRGEKDFKGAKAYKEASVEMTRKWREANGLQDFYSSPEAGEAGPTYLLGPAS